MNSDSGLLGQGLGPALPETLALAYAVSHQRIALHCPAPPPPTPVSRWGGPWPEPLGQRRAQGWRGAERRGQFGPR